MTAMKPGLDPVYFADKPEFSLIAALVGTDQLRRDALGPGDDACLLPQADGRHLAVSTDASVEGVHYRLDWVSPALALRKAVMSNLSDINAMGGKTTHVFLSLGLGPGWDMAVVRDLGEEMRALAAAHDFLLAGGDTVRVPQDSFFAITVLGEIKGQPLLRSAVKPGHRLYVSGSLGASAAGLQLLRQGWRREAWPLSRVSPQGSPEEKAVAIHLSPQPPLALGPALAAHRDAVAAIDISDGLSSESAHLSRQSACRLVIDWSKLPYDPALPDLFGAERLREGVLHGGEEYSLLFAGHFTEAEFQALQAITPCREIGFAEEGEGVFLLSSEGMSPLLPGGFSH